MPFPTKAMEDSPSILVLHRGAERRGLVDACHEVASWLHAGRYGAEIAGSRGYAVPNTSTVDFARRSNMINAAAIAETLCQLFGTDLSAKCSPRQLPPLRRMVEQVSEA